MQRLLFVGFDAEAEVAFRPRYTRGSGPPMAPIRPQPAGGNDAIVISKEWNTDGQLEHIVVNPSPLLTPHFRLAVRPDKILEHVSRRTFEEFEFQEAKTTEAAERSEEDRLMRIMKRRQAHKAARRRPPRSFVDTDDMPRDVLQPPVARPRGRPRKVPIMKPKAEEQQHVVGLEHLDIALAQLTATKEDVEDGSPGSQPSLVHRKSVSYTGRNDMDMMIGMLGPSKRLVDSLAGQESSSNSRSPHVERETGIILQRMPPKPTKEVRRDTKSTATLFTRPSKTTRMTPPMSIMAEDVKSEYAVEQILDHKKRIVKGKVKQYFQVDWKGDWDPTWEPEANVSKVLIEEYWEGTKQPFIDAASDPDGDDHKEELIPHSPPTRRFDSHNI